MEPVFSQESNNNPIRRMGASPALSSIPLHLYETPWLDYERATVLAQFVGLGRELTRLDQKASASRVHDARVTLRRWFSVWNVLEEDGWSTPKFEKRVGKKLKRLLKVLGELRDRDVNVEMGTALGVSENTLAHWADEQTRVKKQVNKQVLKLDVDRVLTRLDKHISKRPQKLRTALGEQMESAYAHLTPFVSAQEEAVRRLEETAATPEELHQLRLGIKTWRYLLTEFFGLTNLELVKAQQQLGKLNDLHRIGELVRGKGETNAEQRISAMEKELLSDFARIRKSLPYGLRPVQISIITET